MEFLDKIKKKKAVLEAYEPMRRSAKSALTFLRVFSSSLRISSKSLHVSTINWTNISLIRLPFFFLFCDINIYAAVV